MGNWLEDRRSDTRPICFGQNWKQPTLCGGFACGNDSEDGTLKGARWSTSWAWDDETGDEYEAGDARATGFVTCADCLALKPSLASETERGAVMPAKSERDHKARDCASCGEADEQCPMSARPCGHHCNHSWSHDECCWCGQTWGEESAAALASETERGQV